METRMRPSDLSNFKLLPAALGPIEQICFITSDIPASVNFWARTFGAGPFFHMEHIDLLDVHYRGAPIDLDQSIALGYWDDLQIEFIHQHNDAPSIFTDWTNGKRCGLHHGMVRSADVERTRSDLAKVGMTVVQEARVGAGGEYVFLETGSEDMPYLEVVRLEPIFDKLFAFMKRAAREWDGTQPLRSVPDISEWS
jgi:hypothetical protein